MKTYHFSCGDSTTGAVGLAGAIQARTKVDALRSLRRALSTAVGLCGEVRLPSADSSIEYVNIYLNPENVRASDIDGDN